MTCCQNNCLYATVIVGILAGVAVGVLYALGFITLGVLLWVYLTVGIGALLLSPVYSALSPCFCTYRRVFLVGAFGAIVATAVAFVTLGVAPLALYAVILGLATLFVVLTLGTAVCTGTCNCHTR